MLINVMDKGLVTLPKKMRDRLGIKPGDTVDIEVKDDEIVLKPVRVVPKSQEYFWTEKVQKRIMQSEKDIEAGRFRDFEDADELMEELHGED
jgi:AbrB family looped-hinge helix DNA binding protein